MADILYSSDITNDDYSSVYPTGSYPKAGPDPAPFSGNPHYLAGSPFLWHYESTAVSLLAIHSLYRVDLSIYSVSDTSEPVMELTTYVRTQ